MNKLVIIINGKGGVGKDTMCEFAAKHYRVRNISSVTPIKEIAAKYGGWKGQKDAKSRKFLADLKQLFVDYNNLPFVYQCRQYEEFMKSEEEILFVHIREGKEIDQLKNWVPTACVTLLVERDPEEKMDWGNASDDQVKEYRYDYVYHNVKPLEEAEKDFCEFLKNILERTDEYGHNTYHFDCNL